METASPLRRLLSVLPEGRMLPEAEWRGRHRGILVVVAAHAVGLPFFALYMGTASPLLAFGEGLVIALLAVVAAIPVLGRRFRSSAAALGLVTASAVLVQFSGGYIEAHFHYFVVVAIVALYQDWVPFLLTVLYVAVDHGLIGSLAPDWVYNHPAAQAEPWKWAGIHAILVLAECAALISVWRASEQARARSDLVLRSTGEGLLGVGLDGRVTFANPAAEAMTGRSEQELVGAPAAPLFGRAPTALAPGFHGPGRVEETTLLLPAGPVPIEVVATPILRGREVQGTVIAFKDIRERKRAEQEHASRVRQESQIKRLQEEAAFKTLFINTAAHELRTPLTPLKLQLHVLRGEKRGNLNPEQRRIASILGRNLDRLGHLVEDVLDVGRLQAGRVRLERETMRLDRVAAEVVEAFQELAQKSGVRLACHGRVPVLVDGDPKRFSQILFNLVDNAIKFTPAGGHVDVTVGADDQAVVEVRDTGVGLTEEAMAKLFQPFSQAHDPMERTNSGSGLGLYISRGFAELHGGSLACSSAGPGTGSVFTLRVPLLKALEAPAPAAA